MGVAKLAKMMQVDLLSQVYGKPAPEATIDTENFLASAPKDADDEEAASWCGLSSHFLLAFWLQCATLPACCKRPSISVLCGETALLRHAGAFCKRVKKNM
jgi:hypothetical protein